MVVTGASTGVGKSIAQYFTNESYTVCGIARSETKLETLGKELGAHFEAYPCDVADKEAVQSTFDSLLKKHGKVDVLINNAGIVPKHPIDFDMIDQVIDTNLKGTMYCTYAVLPAMKQNGGGSIFNVASIAGVDIGHLGNDGLYHASKFGQVAFGEAVGKKYRKDGILVTTLSPGGIDTPLWNDENPYPFEQNTMIQPGEIAELIDYLLKKPKRLLFKNVIFVPTVEDW